MSSRNRWILVSVVVVVIMAAVAFTVFTRRAAENRSLELRKAARGVVAAIARGDAVETASRFGRDIPGSELTVLRRAIPASLGADPILYTAPFVNPNRDGVVNQVEVQNMRDPNFAVLVQLKWNAETGRWQVLRVVRTAAK